MPGSVLTPVAEAQAQLLADAPVVTEARPLALLDCLGAVLAEDLISSIDVPPADNSAMDGYAIRFADLAAHSSLQVTQKIFAGYQGAPLQPGQAARIFTGAAIPPEADTVVMQEDTCVEGDRLRINESVREGSHIRRCGEDVRAGACVLQAGTRLAAQDIGLAASLGVAELNVWRPLRVAVLSTGDELLEPGEPAQDNRIYNSNRFLLNALLQKLGIDVLDAGIVADDEKQTLERVSQLANSVDMIISSGGVSVGEADYVRQVIASLGTLAFWKLAMKPGKPLAYGRIGPTPYFGLPGNPVSAFATFAVVVRPYLLRMQGVRGQVLPQVFSVSAGFARHNKGGRQEYLRACLSRSAQGRLQAELFGNQGSGVLSSVSWADGFIVLPPGIEVRPGEPVDFLPFEGMLS